MNIPLRRLSLPFFYASLVLLSVCLNTVQVHAVTATWGNTGTDFNAGASWLSGTAPVAGDIALFNAAASTQPNLSSSLSIAQVYFGTTTASGYTLSGSTPAVKLTLTSVGATQATAAIGSANTSGTNTISAGIIFGAATGATQVVSQSPGGTLLLSGVLESTNAITLNFQNTGTYRITGANTYTGTTSFTSASGVVIGNKDAFGSSTISYGSGANISASTILTGTNKIANNFTLIANMTTSGSNALEFGGGFNLNGGIKQITTNNTGTAYFSGAISNDGGGGVRFITNQGPAVLSGTSTITGRLEVRGDSQLSVTSIGMSGSNSSIGAGSLIQLGSASTTASHLRYIGTGDTTNRTLDLATTTAAISLTQDGTGLLNFTGSVTVSGTGNKTFTLQGSSAGTGQISGAIPDAANGTVLSLTKAGTGLWTLSGSNSYSGVTTVSGGTLRMGNANALGTTVGATSISSGATLDVNGFSTADALTLNGSLVNTNTGTAATLTGAVTSAGGTGVISGDGAIDINAALTGALGTAVTKNGSGSLTLSGASQNVNLSMVVNSGTVLLAKTNVRSIRGDTGLVVNGGYVQLGGTGGDQILSTSPVTLNGGTFDVNTRNEQVASLQVGTATTSAVIVGTTGTLTSIVDIDARRGSSSAILGGTAGLTKSTSGTVTLTAANVYTGATTINQGTLLINGSGASAVTVNSGGVLGGGGNVGAAVTINAGGVLSPGSSIESLASGAVVFSGSSSFAYEVDSAVATSVGADLLVASGNLTLNEPVTLTLTNLSVGTFTNGTTFSLINYSGAWNAGRFTYNAAILNDDSQFTFNGQTWQIDYNAATGGLNFTGDYLGGSDSFVNITVVPEPGTVGLLGLGLGALLLRARSRRRLS